MAFLSLAPLESRASRGPGRITEVKEELVAPGGATAGDME
jgi:hypothetical protein